MNDKLEKLALSVRRQPASRVEDWEDVDRRAILLAKHAAEDRKKGAFPYDDPNLITVTDFYKGKDIFITGGTGFVGKVLIEKLLRSTPEGGRLFVLIRSRRGLSPSQRLRAMLELPLFKLLMAENSEASKRLVAVEGDCGSLGFGLSTADRQTIIDNVSIVFHCAATVRFNLPTAFLIRANTRSTRELVYLCKDMKKLDVLVHVSTGYSCATTDRITNIPEEVVPQDIDWRTAIAASERCEQDKTALHLLFEKLNTKHITNYTFSKALSENLLEEEAKSLPVVIVRPTVVIATYEDPFGGWVDNLYGPMSIWDATGRGILRTHIGRSDTILDVLPVDWCVKTLITAAWHRGIGFRMRSDPDKIDVVNNSTCDINTVTLGKMYQNMHYYLEKNSHRYIFRYPRFFMTSQFWLFWLITITSHLPLGILVDTALTLKGKPPILLAIYRRLYEVQSKFIYYFCLREFHFDSVWQYLLDSRVPKSDRGRFSIPTKTYATDYYHDNLRGLIKYVFKEKIYTGPESNRKIMHIVDWIHSAFLAICGLWIISWLLSSRSTAA